MKLMKFCYFYNLFSFSKNIFKNLEQINKRTLVNLYKDIVLVNRLRIFCTTLFTTNAIKSWFKCISFSLNKRITIIKSIPAELIRALYGNCFYFRWIEDFFINKKINRLLLSFFTWEKGRKLYIFIWRDYIYNPLRLNYKNLWA